MLNAFGSKNFGWRLERSGRGLYWKPRLTGTVILDKEEE
jgi:hypothetical protein